MKSNEEVKLKPCPFCGIQAEKLEYPPYFIGCKDTTCAGFQSTRNVLKWNKRTPDVSSLVEALTFVHNCLAWGCTSGGKQIAIGKAQDALSKFRTVE